MAISRPTYEGRKRATRMKIRGLPERRRGKRRGRNEDNHDDYGHEEEEEEEEDRATRSHEVSR